MKYQNILKSIDEAAKVIGKTWPLYSFVTSNPLSGYETSSFIDAVQNAKKHLNAKVFPNTKLFRQAWEQKEISENILKSLLKENGHLESPEFYLHQMESQKTVIKRNKNHDLDRIMVKWLAAFMDEGLAEWEMPNKREGFYKAWRHLVKFDGDLGVKDIREIPKTPEEVLKNILKDYPEEKQIEIFTHHLSALPGWTGYINYRTESNSPWQQKYPIGLEDYLGVRLWIARQLNVNILPKKETTRTTNTSENIQYIWLKAWEKSWQNQLLKNLKKETVALNTCSDEKGNPDAQLVFCIDTRSELIRRHVESKGNYETFGYAGFFGIAMDYENLDDGIIRKSCPPIVGSAYKVTEIPQKNHAEKFRAHKKKIEGLNFREYFLRRMKNMLPSAFGYVEGSGFFYGLSLFARTMFPKYSNSLENKNSESHETFCNPEITSAMDGGENNLQISLAEKVAIVKSAFDLTGWKRFSPLVLFVGHGSKSANNPFGSSLDCGACAASPGRHNARMLAKLANLPSVRKVLVEEHRINIPNETLFIGAEHNTTTDEIVIFDAQVPDIHKEQLKNLKTDLLRAQETATKDRLDNAQDSVSLAKTKSSNWGETRPEWGLAKNAGFIVAPRALTHETNLESRCFLHSYNWETDMNGEALEGIMQGPMVVTQWINNHYYFSTVDNATFGGGSKITHNVTGKFGVVQGNGGDLKMGLPLQSLLQNDDEMYHRPLRLSVLVQAPKERVSKILLRNENLRSLLDNEWIYLMVMDPLCNNEVKHYKKCMKWISATGETVKKDPLLTKINSEILEEIPI